MRGQAIWETTHGGSRVDGESRHKGGEEEGNSYLWLFVILKRCQFLKF